METFFHPRSVAVIGASEGKLGGTIILNIKRGFKGDIFPVNPNCKQVYDLPCYPTLESISQKVDLAIVMVPAKLVPSVIEACSENNIKNVIIESAGFAEVGAEGKALQDQCKEIAQKAGIRIWGPNCMGLVDLISGNYFTFMHQAIHENGIIPGKISLIVQSGMMSAIFLAELKRREIGIAKACSIGNRMDIDECDIMEYLIDDPETHVIALYLESILRGRLFATLAKSSNKPIVLLKGGRSKAGALAAISHTSSLSGNSRLLDSIMQKSGVILAKDIFQMMDMSNSLTRIPQLPAACRTAILTLSGGAGILACDALDRKGLEVAQLSEETKKELGKIYPEWMPVANPIDLFAAFGIHGRSKTFGHAVANVLKDPNVDVVLIHYLAGLDAEFNIMEEIKQKADSVKKPLFFWLMGIEQGTTAFFHEAQNYGISVHGDIRRIADCLAAAAYYGSQKKDGLPQAVGKFKISKEQQRMLDNLDTSNSTIDEYDAKHMLKAWNIPVVEERLISTTSEAEDSIKAFGFPVVLKGLIPGEIHKTESGLVHLNINCEKDLQEAFEDLKQKIDEQGRIIVQKQVDSDYELITGFLRDKEFGPCVMFGLGGIFAELEPDVSFDLAPLSKKETMALIESIRGRKILEGFRGTAPLNKETMAEILINLSQLGCADSRIDQIDINPIGISNGQPVALDANIVYKMSEPLVTETKPTL